jgi:hypothetical protein
VTKILVYTALRAENKRLKEKLRAHETLKAWKLDSLKEGRDGAASLGNVREFHEEWPDEALLKTRVRRENIGRALDSTTGAMDVNVENEEGGGGAGIGSRTCTIVFCALRCRWERG